jgi:hypothetical protein
MPNGRRRDVFDLADRGEASAYRGEAPAYRREGDLPSDPVLIARQAIELLILLMDAMPQLRPIIQEFLDKLSTVRTGRRPAEVRREGAPPPEVPPAAGAPPT